MGQHQKLEEARFGDVGLCMQAQRLKRSCAAICAGIERIEVTVWRRCVSAKGG